MASSCPAWNKCPPLCILPQPLWPLCLWAARCYLTQTCPQSVIRGILIFLLYLEKMYISLSKNKHCFYFFPCKEPDRVSSVRKQLLQFSLADLRPFARAFPSNPMNIYKIICLFRQKSKRERDICCRPSMEDLLQNFPQLPLTKPGSVEVQTSLEWSETGKAGRRKEGISLCKIPCICHNLKTPLSFEGGVLISSVFYPG